MRVSFHELDRVLLEAVSDDYQSFESLVGKVSQSKDAHHRVIELERILLSAIANHLVSAYLIHADPPYATEVGANAETIQRYWFCITEEGRDYLRRMRPKQSILRRHRTR